MRVTSAVIQRELRVSYYEMFLNDDDSLLVLRAQCKRRPVQCAQMFSTLLTTPVRRNANDKRCVCRLQIACE
jgi:hypothetical protein